VKPAVVLNPATPLSSVEVVLPDVEMILLMSVNPGFGGQKFIESAIDKLHAARRFKDEHRLGYLIEVDGGVKAENAERVVAAGAEVLVVGTGIFAKSDYGKVVAEIQRAALVGEGAVREC